MINSHTLIHLSLITGVGPAVVEKIVSQMQGNDLAVLYSYDSQDFIEQFSVGEQTAQRLVIGLRDKKTFDTELTLIERNNISWTSIYDED